MNTLEECVRKPQETSEILVKDKIFEMIDLYYFKDKAIKKALKEFVSNKLLRTSFYKSKYTDLDKIYVLCFLDDVLVKFISHKLLTSKDITPSNLNALMNFNKYIKNEKGKIPNRY